VSKRAGVLSKGKVFRLAAAGTIKVAKTGAEPQLAVLEVEDDSAKCALFTYAWDSKASTFAKADAGTKLTGERKRVCK
jgi:hypothetical protein